MASFMKLREILASRLMALGERLSDDTLAQPVRQSPPEPEQTAVREPQQDDAIKRLLEDCARAFVPAGRHVRANVMSFTERGTRRRVNQATAFNMENDPDRNLEIDATAAASGKAVSERRAAIGDLVLLQITAVPSWGLRPDEQALVRATLKSILSVPVFDPNHVNGPLLCTLQVDSDLTMEEAGFNRPEAAELLQQYADRLSLLMIGVNVRVTVATPQRTTAIPNARVHHATQIEPGVYVANTSTSIFQI